MDNGALADRMALLGTETAFEVLAKAKALEPGGGGVVRVTVAQRTHRRRAPRAARGDR